MTWSLKEYAARAATAAGILSPIHEMTNEDRLVELLTGLRHWAEQNQLDWPDLLGQAEHLYCEDLDDGSGVPPDPNTYFVGVLMTRSHSDDDATAQEKFPDLDLEGALQRLVAAELQEACDEGYVACQYQVGKPCEVLNA